MVDVMIQKLKEKVAVKHQCISQEKPIGFGMVNGC